MAEAQTDIHRDLVEGSRQGDSASQFRLYKLYSGAMFNIALRMMGSREQAEDMLQDAFADAFTRLGSFRFESSFGAWLKRIVVNRCLNELKRKKADLAFFDDMSQFNDAGHDDEPAYRNQLSADRIRKAMAQLPGGARMIFSLYLLEGYDHVEIAQILGISESNSKSQYMRAKRKIKEILMKENI